MANRTEKFSDELLSIVHSIPVHQVNTLLSKIDRPGESAENIAMSQFLRSFPTRSGVNFRLIEGFFMMIPPLQEQPLADGTPAQSLVGGHAMTGRTAEELDQEIPGINQRLQSETGKVVFLGNGHSTTPVDLAERYKLGSLAHQPSIVELFDYDALHHDLDSVNAVLATQGIVVSTLVGYHNRVEKICQAISEKTLRAIRYTVGSASVPDVIKNASLVLNIHGPNMSTLPEQLSLLRPGGRLFVAATHETIPTSNPGFSPIAIDSHAMMFVKNSQ